MTIGELKDTRYYLMKYRQSLSSKLDESKSYVDDVIIMNDLINEIEDEIITKEKK